MTEERCSVCNAGGHTCPGCGHPVPHGDGPTDYSDHGPGCPGWEDWHLQRSLEEYALGVVQEWMRIIELDRLPGQPRVTWQDDEGTFLLGEHPMGDDYGRFRLKVSVETLPPVPPIGPENDPAQIEERRVGFCMECVEPDEDPIAWCDCRSDEPPCRVPCKQNAHDPEQCPRRPGAVEEEPIWVPRTLVDVRDGDTIRMPGQEGTERTVETVSPVLPWHVHPAGGRDAEFHPERFRAEWSEIKVRFAGTVDVLSLKPDMPVEIRTTASELAAIDALGGWAERIEVKSSDSSSPRKDG